MNTPKIKSKSEFPSDAAYRYTKIYGAYESNAYDYGHDVRYDLGIVTKFHNYYIIDNKDCETADDPFELSKDIESWVLSFLSNKENKFYKWLNRGQDYFELLKYFKQSDCDPKHIIDSHYEINETDLNRFLAEKLNGIDNYKEIKFRSCLSKIFWNYYMVDYTREIRPTNQEILASKNQAGKLLETLESRAYLRLRFRSLINDLKEFKDTSYDNEKFIGTNQSKHTRRNQLIKDSYRIISDDFNFNNLKEYKVPAKLIQTITKLAECETDINDIYKFLKRIES